MFSGFMLWVGVAEFSGFFQLLRCWIGFASSSGSMGNLFLFYAVSECSMSARVYSCFDYAVEVIWNI